MRAIHIESLARSLIDTWAEGGAQTPNIAGAAGQPLNTGASIWNHKLTVHPWCGGN